MHYGVNDSWATEVIHETSSSKTLIRCEYIHPDFVYRDFPLYISHWGNNLISFQVDSREKDFIEMTSIYHLYVLYPIDSTPVRHVVYMDMPYNNLK